MRAFRWPALALALVSALAGAQQQGIGDPTFPNLGNTGYKATHYGLKIDYNPDTNQLKGDVTMTAVASAVLGTFSLDFTGYVISAVKLNGSSVPYERTENKLMVKPTTPLAVGAKFSLETIYSGSPKQGQSAALPVGIKSGWIHFAGGAVAVCEPELAHTWFPCNDHPLNKATFDVVVSAPAPYVAISNGMGANAGPNTMHFVLDKPAMTCMTTVCFGKFATLKQVGPNQLPITNYIPLGEEMTYLKRLGITPKFMQYLSERIGPYPFSSYGAIILPDSVRSVNDLMTGSAIETTAIPVFGPSGATSPETLCHELAHQWMGDCVSITNWGDDIWWVEGFAQYAEWLMTEMTDGPEAYNRAVQAIYSQFSSQPHWLHPGHLSAAEMFGAGSYVGGALTFHALRKELGDAKFFATVKQFIDKNRYGNASVKDWIEIASKVAGRDMKPFFEAWLYGDAVPKLPN